MKKFTTLFTVLIMIIGLAPEVLQAQDMQRQSYQQTRLSIGSYYSSGAVRINIDGRSYDQSKNDDDLLLSGLSAGNHSIKIWQMPNNRRGQMNSQAIRVMYEGTVYLRPGYQTDIYINRFNHAMKDEQPIAYNDQDYPQQNPQHPNQYPNQYPGGYNREMAQQNFDALKSSINATSFENSKLNLAKQVAINNFFSATQVKQLLQLFNFDNSRLDLAKALYARTTDKGNYFMLNDAFAFNSSRDELMKYVRANP